MTRYAVAVLALLVCLDAGGQVVINEVFPDPVGPDPGFEWIELYNSGSVPVDVSGWRIDRASTSWSASLTLPGATSVAAGSYLLIADEFVADADISLAAGESLGLFNAVSSGDGVRIVNAVGTVIDTVLYGPDNSDGLIDDSGFPGPTARTSPPGGTIVRIPDGLDSDDSSVDFLVADAPSPGASNLVGIFSDGFEFDQSGLPNQLVNAGFETIGSGNNPPFDPPTDWVSFGLALSGSAVGYDNYATQAHASPIYNPSNPSDVSRLFPGFDMSRGLKMWGRNLDAGSGSVEPVQAWVFQEFLNGVVPARSRIEFSGWAYVSSVDPIGEPNRAYLFIRCFPSDFSEEYCGAGNGRRSAPITSTIALNTWQRFSVVVESLDPRTKIVFAGMAFDQCPEGACGALNGAVFWDALYLSWE